MASEGLTASSSVGLKRYEINALALPVGEESLAVHSTGLLLSDFSFTRARRPVYKARRNILSKRPRLPRSIVWFLCENDHCNILINIS